MPPYDATVVAQLREAGAVCRRQDQHGRVRDGLLHRELRPSSRRATRGTSTACPAAAAAARRRRSRRARRWARSAPIPAAPSASRRAVRRRRRSSRPMAASRATAWSPSPPRSIRSAPSRARRRDAALLLQAIAGHDPLDSTSVDVPVPDYTAALTGDIKGLRVGVPKEYLRRGRRAGRASSRSSRPSQTLKSLGAEVGEVSLPHTRYGVAAYYIIAPAECSANLARYDGVKYGFSSRRRQRSGGYDCSARGRRASAPRSSAASCSAPTRSRRATTTPTTSRPSRCAR